MLRQLTDRCWVLPHQQGNDRPALGFIRGDNYCLQVDAGNSAAHAQRMAQALAVQGLHAPDFVALTHAHWDHTYGLHALSCPALACQLTQARLRQMQAWQWDMDSMERRLTTGEDIPFCHQYLQVEYPTQEARRTIRVSTASLCFDQALTLELGGCTACLMRLDNSHSNDCVVIHVPEEKVIYLGDITYADLTVEPEAYHAAPYQRLIAALTGLDFTLAVPGHQSPLTRAELLDELHACLAEAVE